MKLEELPMREYCMYALGASHAIDYEEYKKQFIEMFLSQPNVESQNQKDNKGQVFN